MISLLSIPFLLMTTSSLVRFLLISESRTSGFGFELLN